MMWAAGSFHLYQGFTTMKAQRFPCGINSSSLLGELEMLGFVGCHFLPFTVRGSHSRCTKVLIWYRPISSADSIGKC